MTCSSFIMTFPLMLSITVEDSCGNLQRYWENQPPALEKKVKNQSKLGWQHGPNTATIKHQQGPSVYYTNTDFHYVRVLATYHTHSTSSGGHFKCGHFWKSNFGWFSGL